MIERGFLTETPDDFGPTIYERTNEFDDAWDRAEQDESLPFTKYRLVNSSREWLHSALGNINSEYRELGLGVGFETPSHEWEPLPLDRADPKLQAVTSQLDETISQIQADNGYAAAVPGEATWLRIAFRCSERLKKDPTISWGYLQRNVFEPLKTVLRRFKGAALATIVTTTE